MYLVMQALRMHQSEALYVNKMILMIKYRTDIC